MTTLIITSFLAGLVAIAATVAVERLGGKLGGIIATLPTTIVPATWGFFAVSEGVPVKALAAVPMGMLVNAGFLWCWRAIPPRLPSWSMQKRLGAMVGISLCIWMGLALTSMFIGTQTNIHPMILGFTALALHIILGIYTTWHFTPSPKGTRNVTFFALVSRGVLAAVAVGVSVLIASSGFEVAAGIASVFPAIFLTTMVSLWWSQGQAVPLGAVGPITLGSIVVSTYALLAIWTFDAFGVGAGTVIAWVGSVLLCSVPSAIWLNQKQAAS
jgi:hypothetical protein